MRHKIGLEHEPLFLSLKTAVYRDHPNVFFWVAYLATKIRYPST